MKATHLPLIAAAVLCAGSWAAEPDTVHMLEDFEQEPGDAWQTWGPDKGSLSRVEAPDREGHCLQWTFRRKAETKVPCGLIWRKLAAPAGVTQTVGWALEFWIRGETAPDKPLSCTLNETDRSCWNTSGLRRVSWTQGKWAHVRVPMAHLRYAWGNKEREGTESDVTKLASMVFAISRDTQGTVLLDDFALVGRERPGALLATVLPLDFGQPPLNRYGKATSLPTGSPAPVDVPQPAAGEPSRVVLREDGLPMVNGKPFLPMGVFCVPRECFAEVAAAGFNTVLNYRGFHKEGKQVAAYLDLCAHHGLMGVVDVQTFTKCSKTGRLQEEGLADLVRRAKGHPALLAYYIADEPEYSKVPAEDYLRGYRLIKQIDPDHPVIMLNNRFDAQQAYAAAADLLMPDPYPNFYQAGQPRRPLNTQGEYATECLRIKPHRLWFTPQFHNGACYGNRNRERGDIVGRAPTLREVRFMVYSALVHGARGIIGWPFQAAGWGTHDAPEYLRALKALVAEVRTLEPALTSPHAHAARVPDPSVHFKALICRHAGHTTLIGINDSPKAAKAMCATRNLPSQLHVVSESRAVDVVDGRFGDAFEPWAVHIYTTDPGLARTPLTGLLSGYVDAFSMAGTVHPTRDSNLALYLHGSRASASSTNRWARANAAINGSYATAWRADGRADEHWLAVDFRREVAVGRALLVAAANPDGKPRYEPGAWSVEVKAGEGWAAVEQPRRSHYFVHWNAQQNRWEQSGQPAAQPRRADVFAFPPRSTTALRFVCRAPRSRPVVYEIEAYAE